MKRGVVLTMALAMVAGGLPVSSGVDAAPTGQGFSVTAADLSYILKQIKIAEYHAANTTADTGPCGALVGPGENQVGNPLLSFGLRTVDGSCNNLQAGQETFGASHQLFPRLTTPLFDAAEGDPGVFGPSSTSSSSYAQSGGLVFDTEPRLVSNLIVDQTSTNPAAIAAAGFPVRTQGNEGVTPCDSNGDPIPPATECVPAFQTLFIPNVTTDVGLSPPFNGLFALFGQFFDHGLDKVTNGGSGTVVVPLRSDDPLIAGDDHEFNTADDLDPSLRFMMLTRATANGPGGTREATNTDTPFVDQSQTYTSDPSHQAFLREYTPGLDALNQPDPLHQAVATGKLIHSADGGMATWGQVKMQVARDLGLQLVDADVNNIPMLAVDPYGNFIPGPARGLPMFVLNDNTMVEGDRNAPVTTPGNVRRIGIAFLNDIAHSAAPAATPDANTTAGGSLDPMPNGVYDNELLDLHFIAGDGRANENIGLTAIHQIFHSEHDRLIDEFTGTLAANPDLKAAFESVNPYGTIVDDPNTATNEGAITFTLGERMFQAARFVTEMEYQHLVFEEFARKVQPAIDPFEPFAFNQTDVNPAITAEFAHAVYRFGHSMLDEDIARFMPTPDPSDNPLKVVDFSIPLLDGFLNPASYTQGPAGHPVLTSQEAAGAIIMGMSDQVGNEIDEFVTDTLRNNLLGLPLDLPAINMTRARSEGIRPLNSVRRQIHAKTNSPELAPYINWIDFGQHLKHPESLVNFVAAYGTHPSITGESSIAGRRHAAQVIVDPQIGDVPPVDALAFMSSTEYVDPDGILPSVDWSNAANGATRTGVDDIDLWVGGLAEVTNPFGGLLGSTFNYVFENQLVNLQNGDRFYYLARTPGMNLRASLEGNSFAELMMRNTTATTLKADSFATADCKFELSSNPGIANLSTGTTVEDDPESECNETLLLIRQLATGGLPPRIEYRARNSVDPAGINGQSVYNGTAGDDNIWGGNDNDTFLGNEGNDIIEGSSGDEVSLGGVGNDVITDLGGDDVLKGGPDHDALDGGIGLDILMGAEGDDLTSGGGNGAEAFLGEGDDFAIGGSGVDVQFGDGGDDWEEGGDQPDLLIGDSSTLFFDDHNLPGHDVMIGQGGDDDMDAEGGDDVIVAGPGVEKNAGASGYDWLIAVGDPQREDADLIAPILGAGQPVLETRDRFNEVEAASGWKFNDILRGTDTVPADINGGGFIGCDALDADGVARIVGLDALVPASALTVDSAPIIAASTTSFCLLSGNVWGAGNILLGGEGSDLIEGRGADDIIDGDRWFNVRISVRTDKANPATEIGSTDLLEHTALSGSFGPGTTGMTLQQAIFARKLTANNLAIVREIVPSAGVPSDCGATAPVNCDTAVFSGSSTTSTITFSGDAVIVSDAAGAAVDGTDTLRNVERLQFSDRTLSVGVPGPPTIGTASLQTPAGTQVAVVTWTPPAAEVTPAITGFLITVFENGVQTRTQAVAGATTTSAQVGSLTVGTTYTFTVSAVSPAGTSAPSALSNAVTPQAPTATPLTVAPVSPLANATGVAVTANITGRFSEPLALNNGVAGTNTTPTDGSQYVQLFNVATGARVNVAVTYAGATRTFTINPSANLAVGTVYEVRVIPGTCTPPAGIRSVTTTTNPCRPLNALTTWRFTTTNPALVAPTIIARNPAPGATGVARGANLTVRFSEPMNPAGFTATSVTLVRTSNNTLIPTTLTYNAGTQTLVINPNADLRRATQFRITLIGSATGIRDLDTPNKPLASTSYTFTTA